MDSTSEATMHARAVVAILLVGTGLTLSAVHAQDRENAPVRRGFWVSLGLGPSSARITCAPLCSEKPGAGASGTLGLGGTIGGRLRLGFEAVTWSPTEDHRTFWEDYDKYVAALVTARYFLRRTGNTYVNVGFGGGGLHLVNDELDSKDLVQASFGPCDHRIVTRLKRPAPST